MATSPLNHDRVGLRKVKALLNPRLQFVGLPTWWSPRRFRGQLWQVIERYASLDPHRVLAVCAHSQAIGHRRGPPARCCGR